MVSFVFFNDLKKVVKISIRHYFNANNESAIEAERFKKTEDKVSQLN